MSRTAASLLLALAMVGLGLYLVFRPPPGFDGSVAHHIAMPFVLFACALNILEGVRTRAHVAQLLGALRALTGRGGRPATPEVKAEAIDILIESLASENPRVRSTAAEQLRNLTGESHGEDAARWRAWWSANRERFLQAR